ncbi:MAG: YcxB family protein [Ruminococcaceae bacterium]|nr:YcxB family protein [Oscillospiraceae bacterium]
MKFDFSVNLTESDYLEFNKFYMLKSPYGEKSIRNFRIAFLIIFGLIALINFITKDFTSAITSIVICVLFQLFLKRFLTSSIKSTVKMLKKKGKIPFSPSSYIEFLDDCFVETTDTNKTEQKYSSIERISIIENKYIYIHTNSVQAYIIANDSFKSEEQYNDFCNFLKTVCSEINLYK